MSAVVRSKYVRTRGRGPEHEMEIWIFSNVFSPLLSFSVFFNNNFILN